MRIRWSPEAADDFERIVLWIRKDNPSAAADVADKIYKAVDLLKDFPERGRIGRIEGSRELVLTPLPYIVVYRIAAHTVEIGRIHHAAQDR